jgi:hypothetical protein
MTDLTLPNKQDRLMQTIQDKIINQIATMIATRTMDDSFPMFETALRKGKIFILNAGCIVPIATIRFDFQDDTYALAMNQARFPEERLPPAPPLSRRPAPTHPQVTSTFLSSHTHPGTRFIG